MAVITPTDQRVLDALSALGPTVLWVDLQRRTGLSRFELSVRLARLAYIGTVVRRDRGLRAIVPWRLP